MQSGRCPCFVVCVFNPNGEVASLPRAHWVPPSMQYRAVGIGTGFAGVLKVFSYIFRDDARSIETMLEMLLSLVLILTMTVLSGLKWSGLDNLEVKCEYSKP